MKRRSFLSLLPIPLFGASNLFKLPKDPTVTKTFVPVQLCLYSDHIVNMELKGENPKKNSLAYLTADGRITSVPQKSEAGHIGFFL